MVQVLCKAEGHQAADLRDVAVARVRFVLRRMAWIVPRARVWMTDVNGPRGGLDKRCRVELSTAGTPPVVVTAVSHDWRAALDMALSRAAQAVRRLRQRLNRRTVAAPRALAAPATHDGERA